MNILDSKLPAHEIVYRRLREMILYGELAPGQAVTIHGLAESLGAGLTPVREALRRLIAGGALVSRGNRRVSVPELTAAELEEVAFARLALEPRLAYLAAERIGPEDIAALERTDAALNAAIAAGDVQGYLRQNYLFHSRLYAQAEAAILCALADALWLRSGPALRVVCGRFGTANLVDRHEEALAALRAGDAQAAADAIAADIGQGTDAVRATLGEIAI